jgi:hypothetical protein
MCAFVGRRGAGKDRRSRAQYRCHHPHLADINRRDGRRVPLDVVACIDDTLEGEVLRCFAQLMTQNHEEFQHRRFLASAIEVSSQAVIATA